MEQVYLTADDVADMLRTTRGNVYLMCRRGRIPFVKQGRRTLIPRAAWDRFVADQAVSALAEMSGGTHAEAT